jgi:type VI protein secretion system component VasK
MLQQGERIRKAYFKEGMQGAHVEFLLRPIYLDADMLDFKFKMNGQTKLTRFLLKNASKVPP